MNKRELMKQKREALAAELAAIAVSEPYFTSKEPPRKQTPGRRSISDMFNGLRPYKKPT